MPPPFPSRAAGLARARAFRLRAARAPRSARRAACAPGLRPWMSRLTSSPVTTWLFTGLSRATFANTWATSTTSGRWVQPTLCQAGPHWDLEHRQSRSNKVLSGSRRGSMPPLRRTGNWRTPAPVTILLAQIPAPSAHLDVDSGTTLDRVAPPPGPPKSTSEATTCGKRKWAAHEAASI